MSAGRLHKDGEGVSNYILECIDCKKHYVESQTEYLCPACAPKRKPGQPLQGVLKIIYDYDEIAKDVSSKAGFKSWQKILWPMPDKEGILPSTPLRQANRLGAELNFENLWIKDDTVQMSASFKDRASALVVARAEKIKAKMIVAASTGNAASSLATIAAAEGMPCAVLVPAAAPKAKLMQALACGAKVIPVDGDYDMAFELSLKLSETYGWYNRNTAFNPYTVEGKKTVSYEIAMQMDLLVPDYVVVPTGDGAILAGVFKGFEELHKLGWIRRMPRLVCVQPLNSPAIVASWEKGVKDPLIHKGASSVADSLVVDAPRNGIWALHALKESKGFGVLVSDEEILEAISLMGETTGVFAEPAGAAGIAALKKLSGSKKIHPGDSIVVLATGHGLKDPLAASKVMNLPKPVAPTCEDIAKILGSR